MMQSSQQIPFKRRIQTRISATLIVVTTILLSGYGAYQYATLRTSSLARLNALAESISSRLAENLVEPIWNFDKKPMEKVILSEMGDKSVFAIQLNDSEGTLLMGKGRDIQGQIVNISEPLTDASMLKRSKDVVKQDERIGSVDVYLTQAFMQADLNQAVRLLALTIIILDAALLFVLNLIVRNMLITQLGSLLTTAKSIAAGDFSQNIQIREQDEIGMLALAFREMQVTIARVLQDVRTLSQNIREGNLTTRGEIEHVSGGWRELVVGINQVLDAFAAPIAQIEQTLALVAQGNLRDTDTVEFQGDFQAMMQQVLTMIAKLTDVVIGVKTAAQEVALRSRDMNVVAEQMSEGASQQAAATEEVSASMQEMAANIRQTADNAKMTENMALTSVEDARAGKQAVAEIIRAMEVIADRISVIQEIASQTNMLSLNATIEAAKAQEYGKGFTVVASSVRDLARQSREAADEIRSLVHSCVSLSSQAGDVLQRLVPSSEKTADLVQEISSANQEQSNGVSHVNTAIQQLDSVTQHNAATAEQVASTAETLTMRSDALLQAVAFFTVSERVQKRPKPEENDLQQRLQQLDHAQLVELLTTALEASPSDSAAAAKPHPEKPAAHPLREKHAESEFAHSDAEDDLDRDFEHY